MAATFPHHSCRRQQSRARHCDRNTERTANPSSRTRIRQVALPANQPPNSEQHRTPCDVQRHRRALHSRRTDGRSKPSICCESSFHKCDLPTLSSEVGLTTMGQPGSLGDPTTGSRELAERVGQKKRRRPLHSERTRKRMPAYSANPSAK